MISLVMGSLMVCGDIMSNNPGSAASSMYSHDVYDQLESSSMRIQPWPLWNESILTGPLTRPGRTKAQQTLYSIFKGLEQAWAPLSEQVRFEKKLGLKEGKRSEGWERHVISRVKVKLSPASLLFSDMVYIFFWKWIMPKRMKSLQDVPHTVRVKPREDFPRFSSHTLHTTFETAISAPARDSVISTAGTQNEIHCR